MLLTSWLVALFPLVLLQGLPGRVRVLDRVKNAFKRSLPVKQSPLTALETVHPGISLAATPLSFYNVSSQLFFLCLKARNQIDKPDENKPVVSEAGLPKKSRLGS